MNKNESGAMFRIFPDCPQLQSPETTLLVSSLQTGDIVLFAGRGIVSATIRLFTRSHWSHVGMVVRLPGHDQPMLLESSSLSDSPDILAGRPVAGVGIVLLMKRVQDYEGQVAVRRRTGAPLGPSQQKLVTRLVMRLAHRPYKNYLLAIMRDLLTGFCLRPNRASLFCSELVAEIYCRLGWLSRQARTTNYVPGHFGSARFRLNQGALDQPCWLKSSDAPADDKLAIGRQTAVRERFLLPQ